MNLNKASSRIINEHDMQNKIWFTNLGSPEAQYLNSAALQTCCGREKSVSAVKVMQCSKHVKGVGGCLRSTSVLMFHQRPLGVAVARS